jgi:hypothetical protein
MVSVVRRLSAVELNIDQHPVKSNGIISGISKFSLAQSSTFTLARHGYTTSRTSSMSDLFYKTTAQQDGHSQ